MSPATISIFGAVLSLVTAILAIATFIRAGRWKETADAQQLHARVDATEDRLTKVETKLSALATREDIAELRAELRSLERIGEKTSSAVIRIEDWLRERSK